MDNNFEEKEETMVDKEEVMQEKEEIVYETKPEKKQSWFKRLSKNQKIILISSIIFIVLVIAGVVLYFVLFNDKQEEIPKEDPGVVIELNNYRYDNGILVFLDKNDNELGTYDCNNKNENNCKIGLYKQEEILDNVKYYNEEEDLMEFSIPTYIENYVFINDFKSEEEITFILYDMSQKLIIGEYTEAKKYDETGLILKNEEGKYGVITFTENSYNETIKFEYDYLGKIEGTKNISYQKDDKYGLLKEDGSEAVSNISSKIFNYNDSNIIITDGYNVINYKKEEIITDTISFASIHQNYISYIKDELLYIVDSNNSKLYEDGYELESDNYIKTVVLDETYQTLSSNMAYQIGLDTEGKLDLLIGETGYDFNLYEVALNNKYDYVNYLDNTLYIYEDKEKTELIDTYECDNKNNVDKDSTSFENCFIGVESKLLNRTNSKDTLGFIPIYNNKYVFINDTNSSDANNSIKLFDLSSGKELITYYKVDVGYYNSTENIVSASADNLIIMAQATSKKYGAFKMNNSSTSAVIPFEFSSIELLNNGYLVKNSEGESHIYNSAGTQLTSSSTSIKSEVIDYVEGFIKVKSSSGEYLVYSMNGTIISSPAEDIRLGNNLFIAENKDKLEVFYYSDGKTNILNTAITNDQDDYIFTDNGAAGFTIELINSDKKVITTYSFDQNGNNI